MSGQVSESLSASFHGQVGHLSLDLSFKAPLLGITALFGASGSGKTTVLRCLAGLTHVPGTVRVGDEIWQDREAGVFLAAHQRRIGYVFQEASLFAHLSVANNLYFGARRSKLSKGIVDRRFSEIVELLGLGALLKRSSDALSGGERQRVALGRALLSAPSVLLLDEPVSALDRASKEEILPYFERLPGQLEIPIIYVSHDISEVARLADRMIVLSDGKKVAEGPLTETLERLDLHPATGRFEASTIITARVVGKDSDYLLTHLDHYGQPITVPLANVTVGDEVRMRVRARDVTLAIEKPTGISIRNILSGKIIEILEEPGTAFAETLIDIGGGRLRARVTRHAVDDLSLVAGKPVYVLIKSISFDRRSLV